MIGYLKPALAGPREKALFRAYQCSLCHTLGAEYGFAYRVFARPDLVFFNIFADLLSGDTGAHVTPRPCVLSPLGSLGKTLPVRDQTDHTRFVAAFAVYIGIEKLRDDHNDEGGLLRRIALAALRPGWLRARQTLQDMGFAVDRVESWMARQGQIERGGACSLQDASRPTRQIARLLFAHPAAGAAAPLAAEIGERVGSYLFYLDNLLDYHSDARSGGYNALLRLFGQVDGRMPESARQAALDGARQQVEGLTPLVDQLPDSAHGRYVEKTLLLSLSGTVRRVSALDADALAGMTLRRLQHRPRRGWMRIARAAVAFFVLWFAPRSVWASNQLAAAVTDTAQPADTGLDEDTGWEDVGDGGGGGSSCDPGCDLGCDGCDPGCGDCGSGCGDCSSGCDGCGSGCDAGCGGGGC